MRVIAGACKGRRLRTPTWDGLRPTSDKLRETLFNIVAARVAGARLLDVFAGTGAIGIEALSRGAVQAVFIEEDRRAAALIAENAQLCGATDRCVIIRDTAARALARQSRDTPFELIVLDPPYDYGPLEETIGAAARCAAAGGLVIVEHATRRRIAEVPGARPSRTVRSGDSALTFFEPLIASDATPAVAGGTPER